MKLPNQGCLPNRTLKSNPYRNKTSYVYVYE